MKINASKDNEKVNIVINTQITYMFEKSSFVDVFFVLGNMQI